MSALPSSDRHYDLGKWPAFQVYGPKVTIAQAHEFISRTDRNAIPNWGTVYATNNSVYNKKLLHVFAGEMANTYTYAIPVDDNNVLKETNRFEDAYAKAVNFIELKHLPSNWIASTNLLGPHGIVAPDGAVNLSSFFGTWPLLQDIEDDLHTVVREFPWLAFTLLLWADGEVDRGLPPTYGWYVGRGSVMRLSSVPSDVPEKKSTSQQTKEFVSSLHDGTRREYTWEPEVLRQIFAAHIDKGISAGLVAVKKWREEHAYATPG